MEMNKQVMVAWLGLAIVGASAPHAFASNVNIVQNGGFEDPNPVGSFSSYPPVPAGFVWDVLGAGQNPVVNGVDQIGTYWVPAEGAQSLDLNGLNYGVIGQTLSVTAGTTYNVAFAMAGNPDGGPTPKNLQVDVFNAPPSPAPYVPDTSASGFSTPTSAATFVGSPTSVLPSQLFSFDTTGKSDANMGWIYYGFTFTAPSTSSVYLQFTSRTVGNSGNSSLPFAFGPALDDVSVTAVPLPASAKVGLYMLGGFGLLAGVRKVLRRKPRIA